LLVIVEFDGEVVAFFTVAFECAFPNNKARTIAGMYNRISVTKDDKLPSAM
jgi:hypothetical protein